MKIGLEAEELHNNMVTDFKHLNIIKKIIDEKFDHKFIMDKDDPLFDNMFGEVKNHFESLNWDESRLFATVDPDFYKDMSHEIQEKLEGLVVVDFVPTSENLCKMLAKLVDYYLKGLEGYGSVFKLRYIDYWETPKSHCRYTLREE